VRVSKSPRSVKIACNHRGLSHFGGSYFFHEFVRVLHLRHFLAEQIRYSRRHRDYRVSQMLLALVYPIVLGLDRIETASLLRSDGTFQYLTGLQSFPDPQTLRRFLLNAPLISGSSYTMRMIDCCKDSFPCRSIARACYSIWTARWSHPLAIRRALRLATIQAIAASGPMIPGSV